MSNETPEPTAEAKADATALKVRETLNKEGASKANEALMNDVQSAKTMDPQKRAAYYQQLTKDLTQEGPNGEAATLPKLTIEHLSSRKDITDQNGNINRANVQQDLTIRKIQSEINDTAPSSNGLEQAFDEEALKQMDAAQKPTIQKFEVEQKRAVEQQNLSQTQLLETNKTDGYADVLLNPRNSAAFDSAEAGNSTFSGQDGYMSRSDIQKYVKDATNAEGAEKLKYPADFVAKLEQIDKHWDEPQIMKMRNGSYLTRDSIAKGCGYESNQDASGKLSEKWISGENKPVQPAPETNTKAQPEVNQAEKKDQPETKPEPEEKKTDTKPNTAVNRTVERKDSEGPYQVASNILGKDATNQEKLELTRALQAQYGEDTNDPNPRKPSKLNGYQFVTESNKDKLLKRLESNPKLKEAVKAAMDKKDEV